MSRDAMFAAEVGGGRAEVSADADGSFLLTIGGLPQSQVDLADPRRLRFEYVRRLADLLDLLAPAREPLSVVHVGGAGLTLPRYVAATRPRSRQLVLEPDAALTAFVREVLPLPRRMGIRVREEAGRTGLESLHPETVDVVIVDAFDHGRVPADLATVECWSSCARALRAGGAVLVNVTDGPGTAFVDRVAAGMADAIGPVVRCAEAAVAVGKRYGNHVLAAAAAPLPVAELRRRGGRAAPPYQVENVGGRGRPLHDADRVSGPAPVH